MPGFSFAPRSRSRLPSSPISPTHSYSRPSSPTPFERGRLSVSAPNIAALARSDPPPLLPPCPLEIQLSSDTVILRGTGTEAETTHLTGSVILHLPGATDIKGVGLRLLATARVTPPSDGAGKGQPHATVLFERNWDFLEGDKTCPHTLKAGTHEWPFTVELDGSAPSSIHVNTSHASIVYYFRAIAVRPTFSTNYVTNKTVNVVRAFSTEALEYQQSMEIENIWPEKIMYRITTPHKAWAAGDYLSAMLKFTPLVKGVRVVSIQMSIQEKLKTIWRSLYHENLQVIASTKRAIHHSHLVRVPTPSEMEPPAGQPHTTQPSFFDRARARPRENIISMFRIGGNPSQNTSGGSTPTMQSPVDSDSDSSSIRSRDSGEIQVVGSEDGEVEVVVRLFIPPTATPSHSISPVVVSHRVKWDILIANLDGHYSELRCSLPVHLLDHVVLDEARAATSIARSLLFGPDNEPGQLQEATLPSYSDHIRDRVADAALNAALLANNPLTTDAYLPEGDVPAENVLSSSYRPTSTFSPTHSRLSIPRAASLPDASQRGHLEGSYSSELYHSLGRDPFNLTPISTGPTPPDSQNASRQGSINSSRNSSRAPSPDFPGESLELHSRPGTPHRSRAHGKFSLKPFTPCSKRRKFTSSIDSFQPSASSVPFSPAPSCSTPNSEHSDPFDPGRSGTVPSTINIAPINVYDTVPDYAVAASGFLGGGITPLSGLRGLPSYDEAERVQETAPFIETTQTHGTASSDSITHTHSNAECRL